MMTEDDGVHPCAGHVHDDIGIGFHRCSRNGSYHEEGKWWCKSYAPSEVKKRDDAREKAWEKERKEDKAKWKRHDAALELCEGVETKTLKKLGRGWLSKHLKRKGKR